MIILDTNVLSALMLRDPDKRIVEWLDGQPKESVWTTSITVYELRFGIEVLDPGRRRMELQERFNRLLDQGLEQRILPFDAGAADAAALIASAQQRAGRPVEIRDVEIAGITAARKGMLATRNTRHFQHIGLSLIDPWAA